MCSVLSNKGFPPITEKQPRAPVILFWRSPGTPRPNVHKDISYAFYQVFCQSILTVSKQSDRVAQSPLSTCAHVFAHIYVYMYCVQLQGSTQQCRSLRLYLCFLKLSVMHVRWSVNVLSLLSTPIFVCLLSTVRSCYMSTLLSVISFL